MHNKEVRILGVSVTNRSKEATRVQDVLTRFGCHIKTRLGLHNIGEDECSPKGIIILEFIGEINEMESLEEQLKNIEGVNVQKMIF